MWVDIFCDCSKLSDKLELRPQKTSWPDFLVSTLRKKIHYAIRLSGGKKRSLIADLDQKMSQPNLGDQEEKGVADKKGRSMSGHSSNDKLMAAFNQGDQIGANFRIWGD
jgi:hypothetical protein